MSTRKLTSTERQLKLWTEVKPCDGFYCVLRTWGAFTSGSLICGALKPSNLGSSNFLPWEHREGMEGGRFPISSRGRQQEILPDTGQAECLPIPHCPAQPCVSTARADHLIELFCATPRVRGAA